VGDTITLQVQATVPGTPTYTAAGLPTGLTINTSSGSDLREHRLRRRRSSAAFTTTVTVNDGTTAQRQPSPGWSLRRAAFTLATAERRERHRGRHAHAVPHGDRQRHPFPTSSRPAAWDGDWTRRRATLRGALPRRRSIMAPFRLIVIATNGHRDAARATFLWAVSSPLTLAQPLTRSVTRANTPTLTLSAQWPTGRCRTARLACQRGLSIGRQQRYHQRPRPLLLDAASHAVSRSSSPLGMGRPVSAGRLLGTVNTQLRLVDACQCRAVPRGIHNQVPVIVSASRWRQSWTVIGVNNTLSLFRNSFCAALI